MENRIVWIAWEDTEKAGHIPLLGYLGTDEKAARREFNRAAQENLNSPKYLGDGWVAHLGKIMELGNQKQVNIVEEE